MKAFLLTALLATSIAQASAASIIFGGWSKHTTKGDFNENHKITAIEYKSVVIGKFKNSYNKSAGILAYKFTLESDNLAYGAMVGAVSGYKNTPNDKYNIGNLTPVVIPYISYKSTFNPTISIMGKATVFTLQYKF